MLPPSACRLEILEVVDNLPVVEAGIADVKRRLAGHTAKLAALVAY